MSLQTTTLLVILLAILGGCASPSVHQSDSTDSSTVRQTKNEAAPNGTDPLLQAIGVSARTIQIEGRLTSSTSQAINGAPFTVIVDTTDEAFLRMGGPFGITAARMVVTTRSFVLVNYLLQEVWDGDPNSGVLKTATHLPLPPGDLVALLRGRAPGDASRFTRKEERADGTVLFSASSDRRVEFLLVDKGQAIIRQYQSKNREGETELDVAFQDPESVDGISIPRKVVIASNDRAETATLEITSVELDVEIDRPLRVDIPASFERRSFR